MPIRNALARLLDQGRSLQEQRTAPPDETLGATNGYFRQFGDFNPEDVFYVIWRRNHGSGFFSNFSFVLAHVKAAIESGMIPVVDFENFPTHYNDVSAPGGDRNSWTYYFSQPSRHCLAEVYQSRNVFFCNGKWPRGLPLNISKIPSLFAEYEKRISLSPAVVSRLRKDEPTISPKTLGVHFRGKEQNLAPGHWFGPTVPQVFGCIDSLLSQHDIDSIFVVTENPSYLEALLGRYGSRIVYLDSYRSRKTNAYHENPRESHRYLLGLEICVEGLLLSRCASLLCGASNVSDFAVFQNNGKFKFVQRIDNGQNSDHPVLAPIMYRLRKNLPPFFGGLRNDVVTTQDGIVRREKVQGPR